jgi:hypothetical protein
MWSKYNELRKSSKYLNEILNSSDKINDLPSSYEINETTVFQHCMKIITPHGIKKLSLLKSLDNSNTLKFGNVLTEEKYKVYSDHIEGLIKKDKLMRDLTGKIYNTQK